MSPRTRTGDVEAQQSARSRDRAAAGLKLLEQRQKLICEVTGCKQRVQERGRGERVIKVGTEKVETLDRGMTEEQNVFYFPMLELSGRGRQGLSIPVDRDWLEAVSLAPKSPAKLLIWQASSSR